MAFDRFLIAPFNTGLQTNLRPFLIMDDAFSQLNNVYVFRGRVRKRFGSILMGSLGQRSSRLKVQVGTLGAPISPVPGNKFNYIGQMFSVGPDIFTVTTLGVAQTMLSTNPLANGTFDTTNGAFVIVDPSQAGGTPIFWYPSLPVMGITVFEMGPINDQPSFAFDTQFAYTWDGTQWVRSVSAGNPVWKGNNLNFFWTADWMGLTPDVIGMYVTNFNATTGAGAPAATDDPIWFYNGATAVWTALLGSTANGIFFAPNGGARQTSPFVQTARIIVPFKDRLLLLNTIENNNTGGAGTGIARAYVNRVRYSFNGSPLALNAWYEPNQVDAGGLVGAGGGFLDAPTEEQIISAEFIKDRLIVFFQKSTWELAYTGNQQLPFVFQKINTELGSESEFSSVPFDKEILTIGNVGVHSCNGANVERIDQKIPDEIFEIRDKNSGSSRVAGIRDYFMEMVYWAFPSDNQQPNANVYPNRVLTYNYRIGSWAFNDDSFTAFGYFEQQVDTTWATAEFTWESANNTWISGIDQAQFRQIIAGNQEGWVVIIDPEESRNSPSLQITSLTIVSAGPPTAIVTMTVVDHNMNVLDFVLFENITGTTNLNGKIGQILSVTSANVITVSVSVTAAVTGAYSGGGTLARVSEISITSKQWNPYDKLGRNVYIQKIDFAVQKTAGGEITVDYFPSSTQVSMLTSAVPGASMGNGVLETKPYPAAFYPLEQYQERLWHPVYFQTEGECIQINMYFSNAQMITPTISLSDFELEGLVLHTQATSNRLQ